MTTDTRKTLEQIKPVDDALTHLLERRKARYNGDHSMAYAAAYGTLEAIILNWAAQDQVEMTKIVRDILEAAE